VLKKQYQNKLIEVGCDEAGRGCLAGPVVGAAVILPKGYRNKVLNDSKQLTEKQRNKLRIQIEKKALAWAVGFVWPEEIDKINILQASFLAVHRAIDQLTVRPEFIAMDGNRFKPYGDLPFHCEIKGDGKLMNIAAASVLAKTHRDDYMKSLIDDFPHYSWQTNKGYPTKQHREGIRHHGTCKHHRMSFQLLPVIQTELDLF